MTTDITELAQSLKAAAEKATPGRWEYYPGNTSIEYNVDSMDEDQGSIVYVDSGDFTQAQTERNGEFIALANPANILVLVEALEKAQQRIAELEDAEQKLCAANVTLDARAELDERQLESRTVTVKLASRRLPSDYVDGEFGNDDLAAIHNACRLECKVSVEKYLSSHGIVVKWEAE
ncbi:ead/Ea22-like family protein [Raoultella ornithinolytica]|uniref:ead/Ea22-like family protein n=1 Tax=Raoultella ornithinolytica TaxID=54291 RepID=UPI00190CBC97|nr:ead/Ea22-like family protein [Raoultella ornithinolytica]